MKRRSFLAGGLVGTTGGFLLGRMPLDSRPSSPPIATPVSSGSAEYPTFDFYPVTHYNDLFILFTQIGQNALPLLRAMPEYREIERDVFAAVMELRFFELANDFAVRLRAHFNDKTMISSSDRIVTRKLVGECIRDYPRAWAPVIHKMVVHSPDVFLAYAKQVSN